MGFSPYTAHYIITNSLYLYKPFHSLTCLGWLFALQPSFMTLLPYTATHAIGSLRVPLRGVTHSLDISRLRDAHDTIAVGQQG